MTSNTHKRTAAWLWRNRIAALPFIASILSMTACSNSVVTSNGRFERVRVDVLPDEQTGIPNQTLFAMVTDTGGEYYVDLQLDDWLAVNGNVKVRWPPDGGPDASAPTDPIQGVPAVVIAEQQNGIAGAMVEVVGDPIDGMTAGNFPMRLPAGTYNVTVIPTTHAEVLVRQEFSDHLVSPSGSNFHFMLDRGYSVQGTVRFGENCPTDCPAVPSVDVDVWARRSDGSLMFTGQSMTTTQFSGYDFTLPPGEYVLRFSPSPSALGGPMLPRWEEDIVVVDAPLENRSTLVPTWPAVEIRGWAIDDSNSPLDGIEVIVDGFISDATVPTLFDVPPNSRVEIRTTTLADGTFVVEAPPGTYELALKPPPQATVGTRVLENTDQIVLSTNNVVLDPIVLSPRPVVTGTIRSPTGQPVSGAVVTARHLGYSGLSTSAVSGDDGTFYFKNDMGEIEVRVEPPYGSGFVSTTQTQYTLPASGIGIDIALEQGRIVQGRVFDARSTLVQGALVSFVHPETGVELGIGITNGLGEYSVAIPMFILPMD